jgi:hypothetical protein
MGKREMIAVGTRENLKDIMGCCLPSTSSEAHKITSIVRVAYRFSIWLAVTTVSPTAARATQVVRDEKCMQQMMRTAEWMRLQYDEMTMR